MHFTDKFLETACRWAFEHGTLCIEDSTFIPTIEQNGMTISDVSRCKLELEKRGFLRNHHVIGGMRDFTLNRAVFRSYIISVISSSTMTKAQNLFSKWKSGMGGETFNDSDLASQLGVTVKEARYIIEVLG